jgi:S-adenosylmethionine decarboxylase
MAQQSSLAVAETAPDPVPNGTTQKDYFVERDGELFAGAHVLADLWGASHLDDEALIERALREAVDACGATLLHIHLHRFSDSGGISGVAVLAESHISVHTWPEREFAAFDIFMCGRCDPKNALPVLRRYFEPTDTVIGHHKRGLVR